MREGNKDSTPSKNGGWKSFVFASFCTLPLAAFTFLHFMAASNNLLTLLDKLKFCAAFFAPIFPIAALLALVSSGFALKQHPKMFPVLTLYILVATGHIFAWVLMLYWGD